MQFKLEPMNDSFARAIAGWHYEGVHAFYDADQDAEDLRELLDSHGWTDRYYAVLDGSSELVGFFSFNQDANRDVTLGLGLRPDLTGRGLGEEFLAAGLDFAGEKFSPRVFPLSVATFNQRAIKVYERMGFTPDGVFMNETNGGCYEFLRMVRR